MLPSNVPTAQPIIYRGGKPSSIAIDSTGELILAANPNRRYLMVQNVGPSPVYLSFGGNLPVAGQGIWLNAQPSAGITGGSYEQSESVCIGDIRGICDADSSTTVSVLEGE